MYRADGMRVRKVGGINMHWQEPDGGEAGFYIYSSNLLAPTWRYFYDGQMMQEDDKTIPNMMGNPTISGNSYALGARGVDRIRPWTYANGVRTYGQGQERYPVYDGHGNMILTLTRDGTNFAQDNKRTYDVWGSVRSGSGDATHRYCANLGHVQDPESDLVYMRARYYEPWTGRFISEDPSHDGANWFAYCAADPVNAVDQTGRYKYKVTGYQGMFDLYMILGPLSFSGAALLLMSPLLPPTPKELAVAYVLIATAAASFAGAFGQTSMSPNALNEYFQFALICSSAILGIMGALGVTAGRQESVD